MQFASLVCLVYPNEAGGGHGTRWVQRAKARVARWIENKARWEQIMDQLKQVKGWCTRLKQVYGGTKARTKEEVFDCSSTPCTHSQAPKVHISLELTNNIRGKSTKFTTMHTIEACKMSCAKYPIQFCFNVRPSECCTAVWRRHPLSCCLSG